MVKTKSKYREMAEEFPFGLKELASSFNTDEKIAIFYTLMKENALTRPEIQERTQIGDYSFKRAFKQMRNNGVIARKPGHINPEPELQDRYEINDCYKNLVRGMITTSLEKSPQKYKDYYAKLVELFRK